MVDMHHFNSGAQSVLAYGTVNGSLVGWDLRSSSNAWTLKHDLKLGLITSFAVDIHQCWLCIGKSVLLVSFSLFPASLFLMVFSYSNYSSSFCLISFYYHMLFSYKRREISSHVFLGSILPAK